MRRAGHNVHAGLPRGARSGLLSRLRGRPPLARAAWSQPPNPLTTRPRCSGDAGRLDAGASKHPRRPMMRVHFSETESVAVAVSESVTKADQGTRKSRSLGRAGCVIVPDRLSGTAARPAQLRHRALHGKRASPWFSRLRGRPPAHHRRGRSPPIIPRATTPMVRRWGAGTPERPSVPEGR